MRDKRSCRFLALVISLGRAVVTGKSTGLKILAVGLLMAFGQAALAQQGGWSTPVMPSAKVVRGWWPDIAVDAEGQPHVVWNGTGYTRGGMDTLMYSTFAGQQWLEPNDIAVAAYGGYTVRPAIAVDSGGTLHVTFRGETAIYHTSALASDAWNAASWTSRRLLSGAGTGAAYYSDIAVDEHGGIHVVWNEAVSAGTDERWLWFGTLQGVAVYDGADWQLQGPQAGLDNREVYAMIEDGVGIQWFGTDEGVYQFDGVSWRTFTSQDGLVAQQVNCVAQDLDGRLWFGTDRGVSRYDEAERFNRWMTYTDETGLLSNVVHAIAADPFGNVWVGTASGLTSYDGQNWMSYASQSDLAASEATAIAVDAQGDVWVGTEHGVVHYNGRSWISYTVESGLLSNEVTAIAVDRHNVLWFGTDKGLSRFDRQEWTSIAASEGLVEGVVTTLMVNREGIVWVGTEQGISCYDGQVWEVFELPPELAGHKVTAIAEDRQVNAMCPMCMDVFYRHSTDGGRTWSAPVNLSNTFAGSVKPQVRVGSGGDVYVTWEEGEDWYIGMGYPVSSMFVHSSDGGNTWTTPLTFSSPLGAPQQITLALSGEDALVVVWRSSEGDRFYYQLSPDSGATWSDPEPVPDVFPKPWESFSLDAYDAATDSAGHVHLLVLGRLSPLEEQDPEEVEDLGLMHLVWNGSEWSAPVSIYASSDPPEWPRIDIGAGNQVHATWFTRDRMYIHDSEQGRFKIWVSSYQADASSQAFVSAPSPTPTQAADSAEQATPVLVATPFPTIAPEASGLPSGLHTESDDIARLLLALSPIVGILLGIVALRLGWFRRNR